MLVWGSP